MKLFKKMGTLKFWLILGAEIVFAVTIFTLLSTWQESGMLESNERAPILTAQYLNGESKTFPSSASLSSERTLIYFYAPWCKVCDVSIGNLNILRNQFSDSELHIVIVVLDWVSRAEVRDYLTDHELNFPLILGDEKWQEQYKIKGFPTYYLLNQQAEIIARSIGYSSSIGMVGRVKLN